VRSRRSLILVLLAIVMAAAIAPSVTTARTATLRFLTGGLSCSGGAEDPAAA
jgi:hypothetical protein